MTQDTSPLRQRMIEDMRWRKLAPKTQAGYVRVVREFARFLGRSPDTATVEDLRCYQLHLVDHGISPVSLNAAISGLKFFFEITLGRAELMAGMQAVRVPHTFSLARDRVFCVISSGNAGTRPSTQRCYNGRIMGTVIFCAAEGAVHSYEE